MNAVNIQRFLWISCPALLMFATMQTVAFVWILVILTVLASGQLRQITANLKSLPKTHYILFLAFFLYSLLSALWSLHPGETILSALRGMAMWGAAIFLWESSSLQETIFSEEMLKKMAWMTIVVMLVVASELLPGGGVIAHLSHYLPSSNYDRYINKNVNRGLCAMAVLVWPLYTMLRSRNAKHLAIGSLLATTVAILGLDSLSAKLGLLVGAVFLLWNMPVLIKKAVPWVAATGIALMPLLVWAILHLKSLEPILPILESFSSGRLPIWKVILIVYEQRPLLGYGLGMSPEVQLTPEMLQSIHLDAAPLHPHNYTIQMLLELGVPGLVFLTLLTWVAFRQWQGQARQSAMVAGYLMTGIFAYGIWQTWWIAVGVMALMLARTATIIASRHAAT